MTVSATRKLFIGFAFAILLAILIGIANYMTFNSQVAESDWVAHSYKVMNKITEVQNHAIEMQTRRRGFRATGDKKYLDAYYADYKAIHPALQSLKILVSDNAVQHENARMLEVAVGDIVRFWEGLPLDAEAYNREYVVKITQEEKLLMDIVRTSFMEMMRTESTLLDKRQASNKVALQRANWISIGGTVLVQIIILLLIYAVFSEFRNRKKAEETIRENLHEVNQLNEEANDRNWLLSGVAEVNDSLQGTSDVGTLSDAIVRAIVNYLDIPAAAVYIYNDETKKLTMRASASLPVDARQVYELGEGLVGQAATCEDVVITRDVPADFWRLQSAAGGAKPGEILCMPLVHNKQLKGVLELGVFGSFKPLQTELLRAIADNVAIAINAADAREKIMQLLEQVQEQKMHLQNQQEELRQTNEELTRQAEELQASEEELKVQEEELRQINAELEEKNEAVEVSRQALANKARELEVTGNYKSEFLANMSHELRTPLNSVLILAKLLSENKAGNLTDKQTEYARIIHKSGVDLLNLINDILDLSKIEAGKIDLYFEDVAIDTIVKDIDETFGILSEQKGVRFIINKSQDIPRHVCTDKLRIEQVIKNLLSNAFKFTQPGGLVSLDFKMTQASDLFMSGDLSQKNAVLEISVSDTGIGISKDKQQMIFEAFQQADGSTNRKYGGTGLGLSISKELVKKLGGKMQLVSEEGKGSTFSVYLPFGQDRNDNNEETTPLAENISPQIRELVNRVSEQTTVPDDRKNIKEGDKTILIIEDDSQFAKVVRDFARSKAFKTIVALQGDEGLYYASKFKPSAIILDMKLPVLDGWSLLKILKSNDRLKDIPVHVISGTDGLERLGNSAIAYLKKPVLKEDLERTFESISKYTSSVIKKVLIFSGDHLKNDTLNKVIAERHRDVECDYVTSPGGAIGMLRNAQYDCVVVDIGEHLGKGIESVRQVHDVTKDSGIPVIVYINKELNANDEYQLKRISDVVIHNAGDAQNRLLDEMELFLYKVDGGNSLQYISIDEKGVEKLLRNKKVLLADDDMRNVFALANLLEEQGMIVTTAADGKEALEQLNAHPDVDIVLLDIMMPEMDGYEVAKNIRNDKRFQNLPIIALTAKAMQDDREKTINAGASDYITKPIDSGKLFSLMRVWLSA